MSCTPRNCASCSRRPGSRQRSTSGAAGRCDMPRDPFTNFDEPEEKQNGNGRQPHRFIPVQFRDILMSTDPAYLIDGLLPRDGLGVIWGPPKCGKSFFAYDLALHIALGWAYRGRRTQQGPACYIACEGERGLGARTE